MSGSTRDFVEAFYRAYTARDSAGMADYLADDVEWTISGPVDVLPFCGTHRGKQAVLDLVDHGVPAVFVISSFVLDQMLVDGDRVATLNRLSARTNSGRVVSYRVAHFFHFRDGKLIENLSLIDSFDAVEQVLGHALPLGEVPRIAAEDEALIAL